MNYAMLRDIIAIRRTSFALLALLLVADVGLVLYLSLWQAPQLRKEQTEYSAARDAAVSGQDRGEGARYRQTERDLVEFDRRLIAKKDFASFLSELFGLAKNNALELKGIGYKPTPVKGDPNLFIYVISFNVVGKYSGVKSFLADLTRLPKLVTLDSVSLANTSQTEESVNLKVQLTVYLKMEGA